jgi:hypothetical protein
MLQSLFQSAILVKLKLANIPPNGKKEKASRGEATQGKMKWFRKLKAQRGGHRSGSYPGGFCSACPWGQVWAYRYGDFLAKLTAARWLPKRRGDPSEACNI